MTTFNGFKKLALAALAIPALGAAVYAVNLVPLKPDSANNAPCTVWGSPNNGMACGKITAPASALDVAGTVTATLVSANIDTTKMTAGSIDSSLLASGSVDTSKLKSGALDTGKIVCGKGDKSFGYCAGAITGTPPTCSCQ